MYLHEFFVWNKPQILSICKVYITVAFFKLRDLSDVDTNPAKIEFNFYGPVFINVKRFIVLNPADINLKNAYSFEPCKNPADEYFQIHISGVFTGFGTVNIF